MAVKKADVAPLVGDHTTPADPEAPAGPVVDEAPAEPPARKPRISEGMRHDIEVVGWAVDPSTGIKVTRDDLP
jgi:hypothetical protein